MNDQLFIPTRIKVGFCEREDTYTKSLAYVIYFDAKGKLRKEGSWEGWRDKKIAPIEYDNIPTEGFVLNKQVGGGRGSYDWHGRMEKVRVFDPRGFEFEITTDNLLFILQEATSTKGKGLEGNLVYAWAGKDLVLVPCECEEYRKSQSYTTGLSGKVSTKELAAGCIYRTKKQEQLIYLGKFNFVDAGYSNFEVIKGHVFARPVTKVKVKRRYGEYEYEHELAAFECLTPSALSSRVSDSPVENYAELMDAFSASKYCVSIKNIEIKKAKLSERLNHYHEEQTLGTCFQKVDNNTFKAFSVTAVYTLKNGYNHSYSFNRSYILDGYRLVPLGTVTFDDRNDFSFKEKREDKQYYKASDIDQLDLKTINVKAGKEKYLELKVKA